MATATKFEMVINVPVTIDIKYIDIWPPNQYGSQVSLKGIVEGETQTIYLKGKTWANLKALHSAGVIGDYDKAIEEPAEKVNVPVLNGEGVILTRRQLPGERYPNLVVETQGTQPRDNGKPAVAGKVSTAREYSHGGPIAGLDDDDQPPASDAFEETAPSNPAGERLAALFKLHNLCFEQALNLVNAADSNHGIKGSIEAVSSISATLFIAAKEKGLAA